MVSRSKVIAIVPARGGSKSLPRKNVKALRGVPLLAYSIEAGLAARLVDRVIVSTDDEEIAATAQHFGAEVPFLRPADLALDDTPDLPVFQHALDCLEAEDDLPEIVVQLRPTSPLRPPGCVDAAIELLCGDPAADSVRAVARASQNPFKMWQLQPDGALWPLVAGPGIEPYNQPRQALPAAYWQTGHVDAMRTATIRNQASMSGASIKALVVDAAYSCDIDTDADWRRTEITLARFDRPLVLPRTLRSRLPDHIRLVVLDFDGVLTDNRVWVAGDGDEWVACSRSDGIGLERLRRLGIDLLVLSTEPHPVVAARCRKLGVTCHQGVDDKARCLRELLARRGVDAADVVYVGNDVNDLECLRLVGCGVAVADAHPDVLIEADLVLTQRGGHGAVRELCDRIVARSVMATT